MYKICIPIYIHTYIHIHIMINDNDNNDKDNDNVMIYARYGQFSRVRYGKMGPAPGRFEPSQMASILK